MINYLSRNETTQESLTLPAGRGGKMVTLYHDRMLASLDYVLDRRVLGTALLIATRSPRLFNPKNPLEIYVPVSATNFRLVYDGKTLSIGCYQFSARATRQIVRWANTAQL